MPASKFVASIADIKYLKEMPEEFIPYVNFKAGQEGRDLKGDERVAILNVSTTTSYIAVFLDKGKTIKDIETEVKDASAVLNTDTRRVLKVLLEGQV
ncbi:MAG: DUF749 family protein [Candidatus Hydrothermarchaeales archaeon]